MIYDIDLYDFVLWVCQTFLNFFFVLNKSGNVSFIFFHFLGMDHCFEPILLVGMWWYQLIQKSIISFCNKKGRLS